MQGLDDIPGLAAYRFGDHGGRLGIVFRAGGQYWTELALPWRADLAADESSGIMASGPIVAMMDMAGSIAVWRRRGGFVPHATLDLRVDHLRPPVPGRTVIGRSECYRATPAIGFFRGEAHDGDPADPIAHVTGTFMTLGSARP